MQSEVTESNGLEYLRCIWKKMALKEEGCGYMTTCKFLHKRKELG